MYIDLTHFKQSKPATPSMEPNRRRISMAAWSDPNKPKAVRRRKLMAKFNQD